MSKFFVIMSVVFVMAFGFIGNASASEDFVGVFAHDITGGLVDKDFLETDDVLEDEDIGIVGKSIALPIAATHDVVKGGFLVVFGTIGGTVYGSVVATGYVVDGFAVATDSAADDFSVVADGVGTVTDYVAEGAAVFADYVERIFHIF